MDLKTKNLLSVCSCLESDLRHEILTLSTNAAWIRVKCKSCHNSHIFSLSADTQPVEKGAAQSRPEFNPEVLADKILSALRDSFPAYYAIGGSLRQKALDVVRDTIQSELPKPTEQFTRAPQPRMERRLCVDCKHHTQKKDPLEISSWDICQLPEFCSPVNGEAFRECKNLWESSPTGCGPKGRFWEPKEPELKADRMNLNEVFSLLQANGAKILSSEIRCEEFELPLDGPVRRFAPGPTYAMVKFEMRVVPEPKG